MKPILFKSTAKEFTTNGIGVLSDALSCVVTEERNGAYELEMQYPVTGIHFGDISLRSLIYAKPNPTDGPEPFRVYRITKPMSGIITVYAQHISYDLTGFPVSPYFGQTLAAALTGLKSNAAVAHDFTFWTDKTSSVNFTLSEPATTRSVLGGMRGSLLDVYGGEYKFNGFQVRLYNQRGKNNGVSIRYGKNLTSLEQDENCANVYTGVYPYWIDNDGKVTRLSERVVNADGTYDFVRILPLDLSSEWDKAPTETQLRNFARTYMTANNIGVPTISLDVSFVQLEQTEEYKDIAVLEQVNLCDTVSVVFPKMNVCATAKITQTVYDSLLERYESVHIGDARYSISDAIIFQDGAIELARIAGQDAIDIARAIANGTYDGGTFIDGNSIYSPNIYANTFNVYPSNSAQPTGSFNLYGSLPWSTNTYHMLEISYNRDAVPPRVDFTSPASGAATFDFTETYFPGRVHFAGGVEGISLLKLSSPESVATMSLANTAIAKNKEVDLAVDNGKLKITADGSTWYLDSNGLHQ